MSSDPPPALQGYPKLRRLHGYKFAMSRQSAKFQNFRIIYDQGSPDAGIDKVGEIQLRQG